MSISIDEIESLLAAEFENADIRALGGDGSYQVRVVSDFFDGLNAVKRQQSVYRVLNPHISSGAIHAINMELMTPAESGESQN